MWLACALTLFAVAGCGSRGSLTGYETLSANTGGSSGGLGTGGLTASGGAVGTGGIAAGGSSGGSTGGLGTGGLPASGGFGSGGAPATGGTDLGGMGGLGGLPQSQGIDYLKSPYPRSQDGFGISVALSADGRTLAVGVPRDSSAAVGINGDPSPPGPNRAGAVVVFWHDGNTWAEQAYIKSPAPDAQDYFGASLSLSADGNRLAVGAYLEDGSGVGVAADPFDDEAPSSGAVFVYSRVGSSWIQQAYLKASNAEAGDCFGGDVALSPDGSTLAVSAQGEDSAAGGVNGDQGSNTAESAGAVYVFRDPGSGWSQTAYLKASNPDAYDTFGSALALSADGSTLVVGAMAEQSATTGIDGDESDDSLYVAGAAYVFSRSGTDYAQVAYLKASNTSDDHYFGFAVALSPGGDRLAIAGPGEGSLSSGVNGDQSYESGQDVGAVYVFSAAGPTWQQEAYIKPSNPQPAAFGAALAFSGDGQSLLVGAYLESSAAAGIDGNQDDESLFAAGAAYLFARGASGWAQTTYLKAPNPIEGATFGRSVAIDQDGTTVVVCADGEHGSSSGVNGDLSEQSTFSSGAAYAYYGLD